ncbi:MAG: LacI family transcriptional regulator [Propionibacteriaceae bacterium]|nr:LacI family transcriptional regulator [Propionibacteriaceae bacterium]
MARSTKAGIGVGVPHPRATMKEVAKAAGVSLSTASRALTGRGYVSADVRDRVKQAAAELEYVPDAMARNLRQQVSRVIGVIVSDLRDPFYVDLASGLSQQCRRRGYAMMLSDNGGVEKRELEAAETFVSSRVAGVILTPMSREVSEYLLGYGIPVVEVDRQFADGLCDAVVVDNRGAAFKVTQALAGLGHRRIALVIDEITWTTGRDRLSGFKEAIAEAGLPPEAGIVVTSKLDVAQAQAVIAKLLSRKDSPTAVFAANNVLAEATWRAAEQLGKTIPDQLSLACFDDVRWMTMVSPAITTVAQDAVAMGETAVDQLMERIRKPSRPACTIMMAATMEERGSTARPTR